MTAPTLATLTTSLTIGGPGTTSGAPTGGRFRKIQKAEVDLAKFVAFGGLTTQAVKLVTVAANTRVDIIGVWNKTTLVGTSFSIGDSADQAQWVSANSTTTINTYASLANTTKTYTALDAIYAQFVVPTSGKVVVFYELTDLSDNPLAVAP